MADGLRSGWEYDNKNDNTVVIKSKVNQTTSVKSSEKVEIVSNISTGNFDVYETRIIGPRPANPIFSYNASTDKIVIKDQNAYKTYYSNPEGKKQLDQLLKTSKLATFDNAQLLTGTDPSRNQNFNIIKSSKGYQSIANSTKPGERAPGATGDGGQNPSVPNAGITTEGSGGVTPDEATTLQTEFNKDFYEGTRLNYDDVWYPKKLKLQNQDCIKFTIIRYEARGLGLAISPNRRKNVNKNRLGSITLPIPGGISDRNSVNWQGDELGAITDAFANAANSFIVGGAKAAEGAVKSDVDAIVGGKGGTELLKAIVAAKATEAAVGTSNILARQYGGILNPNLELLFTGTNLRDFSFVFRLSPREPSEAKDIKKIIRYFKQAMSPKRSTSALILKSPHTFIIEYLTSNKEHPYLNKFKECALTSCSVNYAPDGTYMTYSGTDPNDINSRSMTSYELTLTFQELEPIFDDDYGSEDVKDIKNVGY